MRKKRVIIYDDDPSILKMLEAFFVLIDYEVFAYEEPVPCVIFMNEDGHRQCLNSKPCADIIITDFFMPTMTGLELLENQKQRGCKVDIRNKVIITGRLPVEYKTKVSELGCAFIKKPFSLIDLQFWVNECEERIDLSKPVAIKRKEPRQNHSQKIQYKVDSIGCMFDGVVLNVSNNGICIKVPNPISNEQPLFFYSDLPNSCQSAIVQWVKKIEGGSYLAGLSCY